MNITQFNENTWIFDEGEVRFFLLTGTKEALVSDSTHPPSRLTQGQLGPHPGALLAWNSAGVQKEGPPCLGPERVA